MKIEINLASFIDKAQQPLQINNKWFINLSSTIIPNEVQSLLQLGDNFNLPITNNEKLTIEFIKNIESNLIKLPSTTQVAIRNRSVILILSITFRITLLRRMISPYTLNN